MRKTSSPVLVSTLLAFGAVAPVQGQVKAALGKPDAETSESFTRISAIRELASGMVLLVDRQDKVVQLLDLSAGTVTKVGREGQGPGEYSFPMGLFGLPSGETLLYDIAGRRFLTIGADGKPGGILELPRPTAAPQGGGPVFSFGLNNPTGVDAQGRLYFQGSSFTPSGGTADSAPIYRWDRVKPVFDTLGWVKLPAGSASIARTGGNVRMFQGAGKVWTPTEAWAVAGDGTIARATPSPYRVVWISGSGKASAGPVQAYSPIKVTEADKELYKENLRKNRPTMITIGGGGGTRPALPPPNGPGQEPEFEETMPPFTGQGSVLATPDGEVWVLRTRPATDKVPTYDVFDKTGALVKKVSLNPSSRVVGFGKGTVYVVRIDEDDLQYLQRYKRP